MLVSFEFNLILKPLDVKQRSKFQGLSFQLYVHLHVDTFACTYICIYIYIHSTDAEREGTKNDLSFVSRTDIWKQCGLCSILFGKIGPLARICSSHESRIHVGNQSVSTRTANLFWQKHWASLSFATNLSGHLEQSKWRFGTVNIVNREFITPGCFIGILICTTPRSVINWYKLLVKPSFRQFKVVAMASTTSASEMFGTFKWRVEDILC